MTIDTVTLTGIINRCFDLSMDGRLSDFQRNAFLVEGKRLRGHLVNLLSAQFDEDSEEFKQASKRLKAVNTELRDGAAVLAKTAAVLANIATLVGTLDKLLNVAVSFI